MKEIIQFDDCRWPMQKVICSIFKIEDLKCLHETARRTYDLRTEKNDHDTEFHSVFYNQNAEFLKLYKEFIRDYIKTTVFKNEPIVYQQIPSFRVSMPGNVAVGAFHRDSDYNHAPEEINFWMPFTDTLANNTIWVENEIGCGEFQPIILKYGEILIFDGANLLHGNKINDTGFSRVSVDFRVIPSSSYRENTKRSVKNKTQFVLGEYWELC